MSNCGKPTDKASRFLHFHLKPKMQDGWFYIKDSSHFVNKIKCLNNIHRNQILVTAAVVGLYSSIPHESGLIVIKDGIDNGERKSIATEDTR